VTDPSTDVRALTLGRLEAVPAVQRPDLLAAPVVAALEELGLHPDAQKVGVAPIDADLSDTAAFTAAYEVAPGVSANCVIVAGRRDGDERVAACVVLATTRADVNGVVRRLLGVRKCSFLSMDDAVTRTGMEYGGITPVGLPGDWRVLIDGRVARADAVAVGSGVRRSKLVLPGSLLTALPHAEVVEDLATPVG